MHLLIHSPHMVSWIDFIVEWPFNYEFWPWSSIPRYLQGGVVIAGSAVRSLLAAMQTTPYFIKDDIYLTGLCVEKAKLQIRTSQW